MQSIFIEENLQHQQIENLCKWIDSDSCTSLECRRCTISDSDFDLLMKSLSNHGQTVIALLFNIQMVHEQQRFKKFLQMLSNCPNILNLQLHGNHIDDTMFAQLYTVLAGNCPKLHLLDIGDNKLTNKSIVHLCSLIVPDERRIGLEELILSANQSINNAGWTELFFSISFNSRLRRLALDYNILDNLTVAMLIMIVSSSRTLTHLDLECCQLTEYAGQLFLSLFTKYPVKIEELCLEKNPGVSEKTRQLIRECLELHSRRNSISSEQPLSSRFVLNDITIPTPRKAATPEPIAIIKKTPRKTTTTTATEAMTPRSVRDSVKSVSFEPKSRSGRMLPTRGQKFQYEDEEDIDADIEELLPIDPEPFGMAGARPYWQRA